MAAAAAVVVVVNRNVLCCKIYVRFGAVYVHTRTHKCGFVFPHNARPLAQIKQANIETDGWCIRRVDVN